jgi:hypothetical protein
MSSISYFGKLTCTFFLSSFIFISCNNSTTSDSEIIEEQEQITESEDPSVTYILPSPLQIASIFKRSGLEYVSGLGSPPSNSTNYTGSFQKSLGLGIYSADLAYCIVNNQSQDAMNYLQTLRSLSDDLGFSVIFDAEGILSRFEKNIGNEDSLAYIIADLQLELDAYLEENEKEHLGVIIFTGAWVESLYLGSRTVQKGNKRLADRLGEQFVILTNLTKALKVHKGQNEKIPALLVELESLKYIIEQIGSENEDEEFSLTDINDEGLEKISKSVEAIRAKFVNGNI